MRCSTKYVGLDVHQATTLATVRESSGNIIGRSRPSTTTTLFNSRPRPERRGDATQRRGSGGRNARSGGGNPPGQRAERASHTWQSGRTAAGVKPLTSTCLPRPLQRLAPGARIPCWPGAARLHTRGRIYDCSPSSLPCVRDALQRRSPWPTGRSPYTDC